MKSFQLTLTERDYADLYALLRELGERLGDDERAALVFRAAQEMRNQEER